MGWEEGKNGGFRVDEGGVGGENGFGVVELGFCGGGGGVGWVGVGVGVFRKGLNRFSGVGIGQLLVLM